MRVVILTPPPQSENGNTGGFGNYPSSTRLLLPLSATTTFLEQGHKLVGKANSSGLTPQSKVPPFSFFVHSSPVGLIITAETIPFGEDLITRIYVTKMCYHS